MLERSMVLTLPLQKLKKDAMMYPKIPSQVLEQYNL